MKGTWVDDSNFYNKHFPVQPHTRACARLVKGAHYRETAKRWKRITTKPQSAAHLLSPLRNILNTILERSGIPPPRRLFLKPLDMKASRDPLPHPDLMLAGAGPAFISNKSEKPIPEYCSGMVPIQVMLESEYRFTKRHLSAVHANEIFQQQDNRRYIYALILTESYMRVFMFDPAGCVVAPRLDYHTRPVDFCAVIAGIASLDEVKAGFDTSFVLDDRLEPRIWTMECGPDGPPRALSYRVKSRLFKATKFVSRATGCWLVDSVEEPHKTYVIKDAWIAPSETQNDTEGSLITHAQNMGVSCGLVRIRHQARILVPGRSEDTIIKNRRMRGGAFTDGSTVLDRVHTRIVMDTYGKPIWKFSSRGELLLAFHDAVQAHLNLYQKANILHRDVSMGNILINTDEGAGEGNRGILIDLDYAVRLEKLDTAPKTVGTRRFMSRNLLQKKHASSHSYLDDLESFYYVLSWLICEYDGPGDVRTSRVTKTPPQLKKLDSKDGATKSEHIRNDFDLPIQPWFGQIFQEMAMQLHGFFQRRTNSDRPTLDPERDYQEFIGHFRHAIVKLELEADVVAPQRAAPVPEADSGAVLAIHPKRKAADMEGVPDEPSQKRSAPARLQHLSPYEHSRLGTRYQTHIHPTLRTRRTV
ncbi:hypothetical protein JB92DRAFT_2888933 [Gautieria morchelliformis]|nr:hypothetical protein JB92DRAFT_2888933 [Gautieria morchelliformis]